MNKEYEEGRKSYSAMMEKALIAGMDEIAKVDKDARLLNKEGGFVNPYIKESLLNQIAQLEKQIKDMLTE